MSRHAESWSRVAIERVTPSVDDGRYAAKAILGDEIVVEADVFCDGHDRPRAELAWRQLGGTEWRTAVMERVSGDRHRAAFRADALGRYVFTIRAWVDVFGTWRHDLERRVAAGQDVSQDLLIGADIVESAQQGATVQALTRAAVLLRDSTMEIGARISFALSDELARLMAASDPRERPVTHPRELPVVVDVPLARFSAWYELFPRSASPEPGRHGTLKDVEARLPAIAAMGFDVVYLPPIHPIGVTLRKGKNNSPVADTGDVGSPWAIGGRAGGHKSVHPELGTDDDVRSLAARAAELGLQIALDIAFQASPDHPYVQSHPDWFRKRPDGTIQYAENPPKKYEDIYPFDFECADWQGLFAELKSVFDFWIDRGIRVFRVDNPHTKPFAFWEWCILEIKASHPEVLFLSEAFTRPSVMFHLAKVGFSQSYTYFPWRNDKYDLTAYFEELTRRPVRDFFRGNHWLNTPDILPQYLQYGGRPAFVIRAVLAATLATSYGIYGPAFELCEAAPLREGGEEYLGSEKYQIRSWDLNRADSLAPLVTRLNRIRRESSSLQSDAGLTFHPTDNDQLIAYSKRSTDGENAVLVVVNLDPYHRQAGWVTLNCEALGISGHERFQAEDLLSGARYSWQSSTNYVELDPHSMPAHVLRIRRFSRTEADFDYFS